jgi:two-component system, NarL family, nitrate/nitrite response regulator NarL
MLTACRGGKGRGRDLAACNVLLIDPSQLFREAVRRLLDNGSFAVVGEARSLAEAQAQSGTDQRIDLVAFDIASVDEAEATAARVQALRDRFPGVKIVVLTGDRSREALARAIGWSVDSYLTKDMSPDALIRSLQLAMLGHQIIPTGLMSGLLQSAGRRRQAPAAPPGGSPRELSTREMQILRFLMNGSSNKAIARELRISEATVKVHLKVLLRKIDASNRTQAAVWALNNGLSREPAVAAFGAG